MTNAESPPMSWNDMSTILNTYFDISELQDLCYKLSVDYENIQGTIKQDKARELTRQIERHGRQDELIALVRELRPHVGLNIYNLTHDLLASDDPRLQRVDSLLLQLQRDYERLMEWKQLHNQLDGLINIFGQYRTQVDRFFQTNMPTDIEPLMESWGPIRRCFIETLSWAKQVRYIGKPYLVSDEGTRQGEWWMIELFTLYEDIQSHLEDKAIETIIINEYLNSGLEQSLQLVDANTQPQSLVLWKNWCYRLRKITRDCQSALITHMFLTDKSLLTAANEFFELSKTALWR